MSGIAYCVMCGWNGYEDKMHNADTCPNCGHKHLLHLKIEDRFLKRAKKCWNFLLLGHGWQDRLTRNIALALQEEVGLDLTDSESVV